MKARNQSLDALRGIAILGMVLSGSIAYGPTLPAWMFHAQVPPPNHVFNPNLPGITWVDLVFPFFLFAMGAAIPLSLSKKIELGESKASIAFGIIKRAILLAWFSYYFKHAEPYSLSKNYADYIKWGNGLLSFFVLWGMFNAFKSTKYKWLSSILQITAIVVSIVQVLLLKYSDEKPFNLGRVDIIILVLANMALFGPFIWWLTNNKPLIRLAILPFIMAVFLASKIEGSWQKWLFELSPNPEIYQFYFLKYLFIIIPGTLAGDWMMRNKKSPPVQTENTSKDLLLPIITFLLIGLNLWLLFARHLTLNWVLNLTIGSCLIYLSSGVFSRFKLIIKAGVYLLWLGLAFEAYEGGIKKDHSTYSYYFVCSGLAFLLMAAFAVMQKMKGSKITIKFLANIGQNPLVAYVSGALIIVPLFGFTNLLTYWDSMNANAFMGFLKGVIYTGLVSILTVLFTKRKWFWKS